MPINTWLEQERPREKLLELGATALSDSELLAIFLRTGYPGHSAIDLARQLLQQTGSLRQLLESSFTEVVAIPGMGKAKFCQLSATLELSKRFLEQGISRGSALTCTTQTEQYLTLRLRHYKHEVFACIFLDTKHRIINYEELFHGTIDHAKIYPRSIVKRCVEHNAKAVILAHNHPSGQCEPSQADIRLTYTIHEALSYIDCSVLDHLIIGDQSMASLAEMGLWPS